MEEMFDIVDDNDVVVSVASRRAVHENAWLHRAVHVLLFDAEHRLLVQRRALTKDCSPGLWDTSASGHVDAGEDYETAAPRELEEELGIRADVPLEFLFKLPASVERGNEFVCVYRAEATEIPVVDGAEVMVARWVSDSELADWMARRRRDFTATFLRICEELEFLP